MSRKALSVLVLFLLAGLVMGLAGCGQKATTTGEKANAPIVIGVPTALGSIEGADALRAVQLAVEEVNAKGGVTVGGTKRPFEVVSIDTREHEPGIPTSDALAALEKLITEKKPDAILVGNFRSEVLLAAMDIIAKYKIPYITTIAMTPEFEKKYAGDKEKYKYLFRTCLNSPFVVDNLSQSVAFVGKKFNYNKVYFVYQDVLWAKGSASGLKKWAADNGWEVVGDDAYPTGASDFSSTMNKAIAANAQVIIPIFDMPQAGILVKQARSMKVPALMLGFIGPATAGNAWTAFNGEIDGLVNFMWETGTMPVKAIPLSVQFNENFAKKYGAEQQNKLSGHGVAPAYDSVYLLAKAIERAGTTKADEVVAAIEKTDMDGVIGKIKFNENHQVVYGYDPKVAAIATGFQWKAPGTRVPVFPPAVAEAEITLPDYMK